MISDKGGGGVNQFLIFSDKGGTGGKPSSDFWQTRGEGGLDPPFLADIICEQPFSHSPALQPTDQPTNQEHRYRAYPDVSINGFSFD